MRKLLHEQLMTLLVAGALIGLTGCPGNNNQQDAGADLAVAADLTTTPDQITSQDLTTPQDLTPLPTDLTGGATLSGHVQPIFNARCAPCHTTQTPRAGGLDLAAGSSRAALVGVVSTRCTTPGPRTRVVAGDVSQSYLVDKLGFGAAFCGSRMPLNANPLTQQEIDTIRDWISNGALDN